ncbi:hypothetical protein [Paenibacillus rigui]|nr:hypothetical protein [Paenibacillus rigui]
MPADVSGRETVPVPGTDGCAEAGAGAAPASKAGLDFAFAESDC